MLALAVVVVVRWTISRSTGPLSLLPCRTYCPVKGSDGLSWVDIFDTFSFLIGGPFALPAGAFGVYAGEDTRESVGVVPITYQREGPFMHGSDPRMRVNMTGLAGGDGQVYDVPHIAGLRCDRVMQPRFAARCIQGIFGAFFGPAQNEESHP